jgi:hypothetical protein
MVWNEFRCMVVPVVSHSEGVLAEAQMAFLQW